MRKPSFDIAARTEGGGAAPAVMTLTTRGRGRMVSTGGALTMVFSTTGAPQKWVTPWLAIAEKMAFAETCCIKCAEEKQNQLLMRIRWINLLMFPLSYVYVNQLNWEELIIYHVICILFIILSKLKSKGDIINDLTSYNKTCPKKIRNKTIDSRGLTLPKLY